MWLPALGMLLVRTDSPAKADAIVVLAGDYTGGRIIKAAELLRQGYATDVVVSGPDGFFDTSEAELAIAFAVRRGYPAACFSIMPTKSRSTREEAADFAKYLRHRGARTCLMVTSDFHTRRAGRLFRAAAPDLHFRVIAAPTPSLEIERWWYTREGRKAIFMEWTKTVAEWLGI
jgi:uncharacterized SAM-binding protein YcdF (DUF218 family)